MTKYTALRNSLAWLVTVALINSTAVIPVSARDSDIYLDVTTGTSTAEPNVLIILGTNDRMNVPEPWTEYPGAYDSHVEYLWNDTNIISNTEITTESAAAISDGTPSTNPFSPWGFWYGVTAAAQKQLWQAADLYANATQSGDPGPRYLFRNYNDGSWIYWLPTGTATSDLRLMSPSFNRFRGYVNYTGSFGYTTSSTTLPTSNTITAASGSMSSSWVGDSVLIVEGDGAGQLEPIQSVSGSTLTITGTWTTTPTASSVFVIENASGTVVNAPATNTDTASGQSVTRGGITFPPSAPTAPYNYSTIHDYRTYNLCSSLISLFEPSTVFAPSSYPENNGYVTNQQWIRFEPYLNLSTVGNASYPGSLSNGGDVTYQNGGSTSTGYFSQGFLPYPSTAVNGTAVQWQEPSNTVAPPYHDNVTATSNPSGTTSSTSPLGVNGLPIRIPALNPSSTAPVCLNSTSLLTATAIPCTAQSYAGWTNVAADLGGYYFESAIQAYPYTYTLSGTLSSPATNAVLQGVLTNAYGITNELGGSWLVTAQLGNRDHSPTFGSQTGTPAYFDYSAYCHPTYGLAYATSSVTAGVGTTTLNVFTSSTSSVRARNPSGNILTSYSAPVTLAYANITAVPTTNLLANSSILIVSGTGAGETASITATTSTSVTINSTSLPTLPDATSIFVLVGPTSNPQAYATSNTSTCYSVTQPSGGTLSASLTSTCSYTPGQSEYDASKSEVTINGTCATSTPTVSVPAGYTYSCSGSSCTVTGGNLGPVNIPYPTCTPNQSNTFYSQDLTAGCSLAGQSTLTIGTCAWSGRSNVFVEGEGDYYYGGTCIESGSPDSCTISGVATQSINGTSEPYVYGPVTGAQFTAGTYANAGCSNATAYPPGTNYTYGGTCTGGTTYDVPSTPALSSSPSIDRYTVSAGCGFTGGTSLSIRGGPATTYKATCGAANSTINEGCNVRYASYFTNGLTECTTGCPATASSSQTVNNTSSAQTQYYQTYSLDADTTYLYHECLSDNSSGNYPTLYPRTFNTGGNTTSSSKTNPALSGYSATAAYSTNSAEAYPANSAYNIDVYSVNYLNYLFGAKACHDSAGDYITTGNIPAGATCNPIGRKSRLQIAKDTLSSLVENTNSVRLGLEVFNKTDTTTLDQGGNIPYAIRRMGSSSTDTPAYYNRAALVSAINNVVASSRSPLTEALYEAYLYFSGQAPMFGTLTTTAETGGPVSEGYESVEGADSDSPPNTVHLLNSSGLYNSPMMNNPTVAAPAGCQKNYVIMITNGQPEDDYSANAQVQALQWKSPISTVIATQTNVDSSYASVSTQYNQIPSVPAGNPEGPPFGPTDLATSSAANDGGYVWLDELSYFMSNADISPGAQNTASATSTDQLAGRQSANIYTIGFNGVSSPVMQNAAQVANGTFYVANNATQLSQALTAAFAAIQSYNPTQTSALIPLSSLNRGQSGNAVYLAFFGPSLADTWQGTVKKYGLGTTSAQCGSGVALCLIGQTVLASGNYNIEDIDATTEAASIDPDAVSYWGPTSPPDSSYPNKGGTGLQLISNTPSYVPDNRNVYTFLTNLTSYTPPVPYSPAVVGSNPPGVVPLPDPNDTSESVILSSNPVSPNNAQIDKCRLGDSAACGGTAVMSDDTRYTLINFILGGSTTDANCSTSATCTTWAAWPHFDVQHSKPVAVTYDITQNPPLQYIFYVQDNGMLTAVNANTGQEAWSFLIEEAFPQLSALEANNTDPELYVADGSPVVFIDDENGDGIIEQGTDRVWIYFGLRRGGSSYYALDITNPTQPVFKWKIANVGGIGELCSGTSQCTPYSAYNQLGETWSTPAVGPIQNLGAGPGYIPAVIFAGGYDPLEDTEPWVGDSGHDDFGRAVYVVNGNDGTVINSWGVGQKGAYKTTSAQISTYAIPSDVAALNTTNSPQGFLDRVYVGDLGGNIWRFDISDPTYENWTAEQLASLQDPSSTNPAHDNRKFFFAPAVAPQATPFRFDGVYIGSGDTEHPLCTPTSDPCAAPPAQDEMFMLMDDPSLVSGGGTPNSAGPSGDTTMPITQSSLIAIDGTQATLPTLGNSQGWALALLPAGSKLTASPEIFNAGTGINSEELTYPTYSPSGQNNACAPPGVGQENEINGLYGTFLSTNIGPSGAPVSYVSNSQTQGNVSTSQIVVVGNIVYRITISSLGQLQYKELGEIGGSTKIYWYFDEEQ